MSRSNSKKRRTRNELLDFVENVAAKIENMAGTLTIIDQIGISDVVCDEVRKSIDDRFDAMKELLT